MNSVKEIKKRLAYAENNNLFDAHYINDMNFLIENNKAHLETCSELMRRMDDKDQAIIKVTLELTRFLNLVFHPNESGHKKLRVLIEKLISIPGENNETEEKTCL